jgi:pyruvate kinase
MVTLDTEAATNYELVRSFIQRGANCMRINCAHPACVQEIGLARVNKLSFI